MLQKLIIQTCNQALSYYYDSLAIVTNIFHHHINPYSAGIDFSRQNPTSVDVRFWRLMSTPHCLLFVTSRNIRASKQPNVLINVPTIQLIT